MSDPIPKLMLHVTPAGGGPFYEQIINGIRKEIGEGRLSPHTPLPSFRQLAADLLVSVITVKRAYEDLEREGIIYRRQGVGTFVAERGMDRSRQAKLEKAQALLREAIQEAAEAGLDEKEIVDLARKAIRQQGGIKS